MSEGRKCWIEEDYAGEHIREIEPCQKVQEREWYRVEEARAFTLPELEARDKANFAAGVEAAASFVGAKKKVWVQGGCGYPVTDMLERDIRAILPTGYKSPAEVRREALEEAADEIVRQLGDNGAAAYRILRALAEKEGK